MVVHAGGRGFGHSSRAALGPIASLSLDFLSSTSLDSRITFSRTTTGTFVGSNGLIQTAAINGSRFDYDPVTLAPKGLLVEEQRTNLLTYSEQFDNAVWVKSGLTVSADTAVAPDGTTTADSLVWASGSGPQLTRAATTVQAGTSLTYTCYAKAGTKSSVTLILFNDGSNYAVAAFNLATGVAGSPTVVGSRFTSVSVSTVDAGNGWYRCVISCSTNTLTSVETWIRADTATAAGDTIRIWGAQLEAGTFATSYIPTVASQVTRTADVATMTGANFSSWYNQSEGTFVVEYGPTPQASSRFLTVSDGTVNNQAWLKTGLAGTNMLEVYTAGAFVAQLTPTGASGAAGKLAATIKANDFAASTNGGSVAADTAGTLATYDRINIGSNYNGSTAFACAHIRSIRYYPTRLSNAQLQALTA